MTKQILPPTNKRPETSNLGRATYMPNNSILPAKCHLLAIKFPQNLQVEGRSFY
jgi:hypothetical protein